MANIEVEIGLKDAGYSQAVENAREQLKKLNREHGISDGKLANVNKQYSSAKRLLADCTLAYSRLSDEAKKTDYGKGLKRIIDTSKQAIQELNQVKKKVNEVTSASSKSSGDDNGGSNILSTFGKKISGTGGIIGQLGGGMEQLGSIMGGSLTMGAAAATAGIAAAGVAAAKLVDVSKEAIEKSSQFGKALSELGAITGLHGNALQDLRGQIQDLAKETNTSVVDVANIMAKIGGAMPQLLKNTEGLGEMTKQSSTLAKAGLMSQVDAVEALTTIMGQFSHGVGDASKDVDILANASQSGSAEISDLAATIKVAGVAAANGGLSLQQTAAMAEVLGDKALKGSEAGTQLRNIFSKFSAEGIKDADTMMQTLSEHAGDTAYMVKQFGLDSANAAAMLAEGGSRYRELLSAMEETGTATQMASENFNNLQGDIEKIKTQWDNFLSSFNVDAANGPVRALVQSFGELMTATTQLFDVLKNSSTYSAMLEAVGEQGQFLVNVLTTIVDVVGDVLGVFFDLLDAGEGTETAFNAVALVFKGFSAGLENIKMIVFGVRAAIHYLLEKFKELRSNVIQSVSKIPLFNQIAKCIDWVKEKIETLIRYWNKLRGIVAKARADFYNEEGNGGNNKKGNGKSYNQQTHDALDYAKGKANKGSTQEDKQKIYLKTLQNGIEFEKKRLSLAKTDYQKKQIQNRIKSYEEAKKNSPFKSSTTSIASSTSKSSIPSNTTNKTVNTDKIEQANSNYNETIKQLTNQLQDGMIATKDFNSKKKSALDSLIQAYYKEGKTVQNSSEMAALVKELGNVKDAVHQDMIEDAEKEYAGAFKKATDLLAEGLITDEDFDNKINQAKSAYAEKLIQLGNLTEKQKKNLKDTINDLKADKKTEGTKDFKKNVKDITDNKESIGDKLIPKKKDVESQYNDTVQKYDSLKKYLEDNKANIGITISQEEYDKAKAQLEGLGNDASKLAEEFRKKKEFDLTINGLQDITSLGDSLAGLGDAFDSCETAWDYFSTAINEGISIIQSAMQTISTITELINLFNAGQSVSAAATGQQAAATAQQTAAQGALATAQGIVTAQQTANVASSVAAIAANKALTASFMQLASASFYAAHAYIPFAGAAIAQGFIAAAQAHVIAVGATPYAEGGIIGGGSNHGDMQLARVNSGEMILNNTQQARLFDLLDGGASMVGNGGNVEFKIKGSDLYGSLRNYGSIKSKSGKKLKI